MLAALLFLAVGSASAQAFYVGTWKGHVKSVDTTTTPPTVQLSLPKGPSLEFFVNVEAGVRIYKDTLPASLGNLRVGDGAVVDVWHDDGALYAARLDATTVGAKRHVKGVIDGLYMYDATSGKLVISRHSSGTGILQATLDAQTLIRKDGSPATAEDIEPGDGIDLLALAVPDSPLLASRVDVWTPTSEARVAVLSGVVERASGKQIRIRQRNGFPAILSEDRPGRIRRDYRLATAADLRLGDEVTAYGILSSDGLLSILQLAARQPDLMVGNARAEQVSVLDNTLLLKLGGGATILVEVTPATVVRRGDEVVDFSEIPLNVPLRLTSQLSLNGGAWIATSIQFEKPETTSNEVLAERTR